MNMVVKHLDSCWKLFCSIFIRSINFVTEICIFNKPMNNLDINIKKQKLSIISLNVKALKQYN